MATQTNTTGYQLSFNGFSGGMTHQFTLADDEWTDEFVIALAEALKGLTWPPRCSFEIDKIITSSSMSIMDQSTNPPSFP